MRAIAAYHSFAELSALSEGDDTYLGQALYPVPAEDPNDPLQWPAWKKTMILIVCSAYSFLGNSALVGPSVYISIYANGEQTRVRLHALTIFARLRDHAERGVRPYIVPKPGERTTDNFPRCSLCRNYRHSASVSLPYTTRPALSRLIRVRRVSHPGPDVSQVWQATGYARIHPRRKSATSSLL